MCSRHERVRTDPVRRGALMGRNARIGLFLLMGLVVALARLIEVEVGKARPTEEPQSAPSLLLKAPRPAPQSHTSRKTQRATEHARRPGTTSSTPAAAPLGVAPTTLPASAPKDEPEGLEWPKGPLYTVK